MRGEAGHAGRPLVWAASMAVVLVGGAVALPSYAGDRVGTLQSQLDAQKKQAFEAQPHVDPPGTAPHRHNDPATKNAVSRSGRPAPTCATRAPS